MDIRSFSKKDVLEGISNSKKADIEDNIRVIFAPSKITKGNFKQVCEIYGSIYGDSFDSVIIVEDSEEFLKKRLPMSAHDSYETPFGVVQVNDKYRNELCDEEDDLFINNEGFHNEMSLFHQLMMLQTALNEFSVVSIQISKDERLTIVRELAHTLADLHELRNTLLIFCCDLSVDKVDEFNRLKTHIKNKDTSNMLNTAFSEESSLTGTGSFVAGVLTTSLLGIDVEFIPTRAIPNPEESLIAAIAYRKSKK